MSAPTIARPSEASSQHERRYELDWLRVLAVFGLIPFHVAIIFSLGEKDYISSSKASPVLDSLAVFVTFWGIPLLFLVGGASAWFALGSRTRSQYLRQRINRLLIPFLVGVATVVPVQVYFGRLGDPSFRQSFVAFYPAYFLDFTPDKLSQYLAHLWFIPCLLAFSAITLPLFGYLRGAQGRRLVGRLAAFCDRPGAILLVGLPLGISNTVLLSKPVATLLTTYLLYNNYALFIFFLIYFVYGYLLYADPRFGREIRRHGVVAAVLGLVCWLAAQLLLTEYTRQTSGELGYEINGAFVVAMFLRGFISWFWIVALVSLAMRAFTVSSGLLRYLDDAFYPVYVLHMTVLTIAGFYIVRWPINIWLQYALIVVVTLAVTLGIYDLAIRRNNVTRYLFGLKPKPPAGQRGKDPGEHDMIDGTDFGVAQHR
jgi:Acyltransferase family